MKTLTKKNKLYTRHSIKEKKKDADALKKRLVKGGTRDAVVAKLDKPIKQGGVTYKYGVFVRPVSRRVNVDRNASKSKKNGKG